MIRMRWVKLWPSSRTFHLRYWFFLQLKPPSTSDKVLVLQCVCVSILHKGHYRPYLKGLGGVGVSGSMSQKTDMISNALLTQVSICVTESGM